jgi:hypothetical protein
VLALRGAMHIGTQQLSQPCRRDVKRNHSALLLAEVAFCQLHICVFAVNKSLG